ncbi:hypothetical protein CJZ72_11760 [Enterococcus durans]|nr:hypothetical protein CJZ72_11760 [Enterococcus durans]
MALGFLEIWLKLAQLSNNQVRYQRQQVGECTSTGKRQYYSVKLAMQVYDIFYVGTVSYTAGG